MAWTGSRGAAGLGVALVEAVEVEFVEMVCAAVMKNDARRIKTRRRLIIARVCLAGFARGGQARASGTEEAAN
jgi:hypothetical protein